MNVLLIGPPGSGKGTQGQVLADRLLLRHIAAGDLLRAEVEAGSPIGRRVSGYLDVGELVPDEVMLDLMTPEIEAATAAGGYLLDGFPRTVAQAQAAQARGDNRSAPHAVIVLEVPDEVLIARIAERGRADDTEDVVRNRLQIYAEETTPLLDLYRDHGLLHVIDGTMDVEAVSDAILAELDVPRA